MTPSGPLLLAGGGHSHALLLKRWAMTPRLRPKRGVVLVNRHPTALYSGMVPGLIAGIYRRDELSINLPHLCDRAGVAFVQAEIIGVDSQRQHLLLHQRPSLSFGVLSLDVGAVTRNLDNLSGVPIKPLEEALQFLSQQDPEDPEPFRIVGAGPAGIEVALALRRRWPHRALELQIRAGQLNATTKSILRRAHIHCVTDASAHATLLCTGSRAPSWLANSGFAVDHDGRVLTNSFLQLEGYSHLFASGDCAVMEAQPRPASGVWAVRSAVPLAQNLEAPATAKPEAMDTTTPCPAVDWDREQRGLDAARPCSHGAFRLLWTLKQRIDHSFMAGFSQQASMGAAEPMACRGCAAKLPARPLNAALSQAGLKTQAEDAANLGGTPALLQSVDGFPALVSDPWLNGRLTTLHACSDLWACGAKVTSAMAVVTLPSIHPTEQQELAPSDFGWGSVGLDRTGSVADRGAHLGVAQFHTIPDHPGIASRPEREWPKFKTLVQGWYSAWRCAPAEPSPWRRRALRCRHGRGRQAQGCRSSPAHDEPKPTSLGGWVAEAWRRHPCLYRRDRLWITGTSRRDAAGKRAHHHPTLAQSHSSSSRCTGPTRTRASQQPGPRQSGRLELA